MKKLVLVAAAGTMMAGHSVPACATIVDFLYHTTVNLTVTPVVDPLGRIHYVDPNVTAGKLNGPAEIEIYGFYNTNDVETGLGGVQSVAAHISSISTTPQFGTVFVQVSGLPPTDLTGDNPPFIMTAGHAGSLADINILTTKGGSVILSYQVSPVYNQYNGTAEDLFSSTAFVGTASSPYGQSQQVSLFNTDEYTSLYTVEIANFYGISPSLAPEYSNVFGAYIGDHDYLTRGADVANGASEIATFAQYEDPSNFETAAVPEPALWVMFIGGFGMIGGAMRRGKVSVTYVLSPPAIQRRALHPV